MFIEDGSTGCSGCHPQPPAPPCFAATNSDVVMFTFSLFSCIAATVLMQLLAAWIYRCIKKIRYVNMLCGEALKHALFFSLTLI